MNSRDILGKTFFEIQARFKFYGSKLNYLKAFGEIARNNLNKGEDVARLERQICKLMGSKFAVATSQGRLGIYEALKSILKPGQEVILSPYTIYDVVNMVLAAGGVPVFADVERSSGNINPEEIGKLINRNTGAVIVTHLHGLAADMERIVQVCQRNNVPIIEDVAQAIGAQYKGRFLGTIGTVGVFSFGRVKNVNGFFGGMLVTNDIDVARKVRKDVSGFRCESKWKLLKRVISCLIADISISKPIFNVLSFWIFKYGCLNDNQRINKLVQTEDSPVRRDFLPEGYKRQMTQMQARLVLPQIESVLDDNNQRISNAAEYFSLLKGVGGSLVPVEKYDNSHIYLSFNIQLNNRWDAVKFFMRNNVDLVIQHIGNTADLECFSEFYRDCPVAREVANKMVLLPCYPGYLKKNIRKNSEVLINWLKISSD